MSDGQTSKGRSVARDPGGGDLAEEAAFKHELVALIPPQIASQLTNRGLTMSNYATQSGIYGQNGAALENATALGQAFDQASAARGRGELVEAGQGSVDVVGTKQGAGHSGVLGGDQRHLFEDAQRAQGDVFEVANGRGHDVQRPHVVVLSTFGTS